MSKINDYLIGLEEKIVDLRNVGYDWDEIAFELEDEGEDSIGIHLAIQNVRMGL